MSFAQDSGYTPSTIQEIMAELRENLNTQFNTTYDESTFAGTNWYKFLYAAAQYMQRNEVSTSEIFLKLQEFIATTNERIQRPSVSYEGLIESFRSYGYRISLKPMSVPEAGTISICVDAIKFQEDGVTELLTWPDTRLEIASLIKDFVAAGIVSKGTEVETLVLTNGQSFDFKFFLPDRTDTHLRLNVEVSENNLLAVPDDEAIRQMIFDNLATRYRMGWNFEPQKYYNTNDAPWAGEILLEYSIDGGTTWLSDVYESDFTDLFEVSLENIQVIIS